jgi:hypothetical protein
MRTTRRRTDQNVDINVFSPPYMKVGGGTAQDRKDRKMNSDVEGC